ncbi:MAG: pyrimidine-nucleoside phosphorylase [Anaerolineae bacterium]
MRAIDLITKKRDGLPLSHDEILWFIDAYTRGDLPDYQASALLMAIFLKGMTRDETVQLTLAMAHSGDVLDLSDLIDYSVDKHSSGGIGDKTTLVVLPLVASCGIPVAKMSGRGLGYSGGTIDKLEAIKGFKVDLSNEEFRRLVRENGIVLTGQSRDLAPADGKIYALRDVTATVPSLPLIASSIMSKKIAAGSNGIVLDVKVGRGAFMTNLEDARELAQIMVDIGVDAGRDMIAVLSDMNQPLGVAVGNALEVAEAIECLNGAGPADFREHCLYVASQMLHLAGRGDRWLDQVDTERYLVSQLDNGQAFAKFRQMVVGQGGDVTMVDDPSRLPRASITNVVTATSAGYVSQVAAERIGQAAFELGAGRQKKGDPIDLAVGLLVHVKVGDHIEQGAPLVTIYANSDAHVAPCIAHIHAAINIVAQPVDSLPLFYGTIYGK